MMADLDVTVGIQTAEAEEGLRRLSAQFHREIGSIDRTKAEATAGLDITKFQKEIVKVKRELLELRKADADPEVHLDEKQFKSEVARLKLELARLNQEKAEISVDVSQLKDANRLAAISAKKQEAMAKASEKLRREKERGEAQAKRDLINMAKEGSELAKLELAYSKLSRKKSQLEKEGMFTFGGWPGRTKDEELALRKVGSELDHVGTRIKSLGGDLEGLDRNDRFGSKLISWFSGLKKTRLSLGFATVNAGAFGKALLGLGPIVLSLVGGLSALVGVLGAGIVGASAVGAAALGGFALTIGGVALASKNMVGHLKEQVKAASDYRDAVLKYGKGSEQATHKLEQLNNITKGISKPARETVLGFSNLNKEWEKLTKPARKPFWDLASQGLKTIKGLMPEIATETNKTFGVLDKSVSPLLKDLRGEGAKSAIGSLMSSFRQALPGVIAGLANVAHGVVNIGVEADKFLPGAANGFKHWSEEFEHETGTRDFKVRLDEMIHQAGDLLHLFHVAGQAVLLFFGQGAEAGDEMTNNLSRTIERWNEWMRSIEGQHSLHDFFQQSAGDTENFFGALAPLLRTFVELARALQPVTGGMLAFVRTLTEITTEIARIPGMSNILKTFGVVVGAAFAYNRIAKWGEAIRKAAVAIGILNATEVATAPAAAAATVGGTAAAAGAAAGGTEAVAAGEAAAGGIGSGILAGLKRIRWGRLVGLGLGGVLIGSVVDEIKNNNDKHSGDLSKAFAARLNTESAAEKFTGIHLPTWLNPTFNKLSESPEEKAIKKIKPALEEVLHGRTKIGQEQERQIRGAIKEANLTEKQKEEVQAILRLSQQGRQLHIRIAGTQSPEELQKLLHGFKTLRSGAVSSLQDINKVMRQNSQIMANILPRGSDEARRKLADNFRSAADAIKKGIHEGTIGLEAGTKRWKELIRNARLVEGNDPLGLAKGFAKSWAAAGGINEKKIANMIGELRKMPPLARDEAYRFMLQFGRGLVRGGVIPKRDLKTFKSHAIAEIGGIGSGFSSLNATVYTAMKNIGENLLSALTAMGGKGGHPHFSLKQLRNKLPSVHEAEEELGQKQGGFTVPGQGSGDHVHRLVPAGSFVMNREASSAYGLSRGGTVHTVLEPGERVFTPDEVRRVGPQRLMAMNEAVPRAKGGPVGGLGAEPVISGRSSQALSVGQRAVQKVYAAAEHYLDTHKPKGGPGYTGPAFGPAGTSMYMGVTMATWVRQALEFGAKHGSGNPQPTSGYRPGFDPHTVTGISEHSKTQYPGGAVDFGGMEDPGAAPLRDAVVAATRGFKYPLIAPIGFHDDGHASGTGHMKGGFVAFLRALAHGGFAGSGYTVKGQSPSGTQWRTAQEIMEAGDKTGANHLARVASMMAATQESDMGATGNTFQLTGPFEGVTPSDSAYKQAVQWFTKGYYEGGGIGLSASINDPGVIAQKVEGSAYPELYKQWKGEGQKWTDGWTPSGGAATAQGHKKKGLPKTVGVKHPVYEAKGSKSGGTEAKLTKKHTTTQVPLDVPEFGAIPSTEEAIRKELAELSHKMLPQYREALRQHAKHKDIAEHLKASLKKIEARIRALRAKLRELRYAKAKKRFSRKSKRALGRLTGMEGHIEAAKNDYEERDQYATQIVAREPEEPGKLTEDWIEKVFEPYVNLQESPAYEAVLAAENRWRNYALTAEEVASGIEKNWEATIGWPMKGRKPTLGDPNLHFPPHGKEATGLANRAYQLHDQIERIRAYAASHDQKWWNEHPNAKARRDTELRDIDTYLKPQLDLALFQRKNLIGNLDEGRDSFNWFAGTGSFEESLRDVQGIHWPDQHGKLPSLPTTPVPGNFGGAIWDTQEAISELGLKIQQAKEALGGSEPDRAAELAAFEEAIRGLASGRPFVSINQGSPFMGAYAKGGVALVGERGPELAHMPSGTRIHDAEDTKRLLEPQVVVDLSRLAYGAFSPASAGAPIGGRVINVDQKNYFQKPPADPHTWSRGAVFELEAMA